MAEGNVFDGENIDNNRIQKIRSCFQGNCDSRETKIKKKKKDNTLVELIVSHNLITTTTTNVLVR